MVIFRSDLIFRRRVIIRKTVHIRSKTSSSRLNCFPVPTLVPFNAFRGALLRATKNGSQICLCSLQERSKGVKNKLRCFPHFPLGLNHSLFGAHSRIPGSNVPTCFYVCIVRYFHIWCCFSKLCAHRATGHQSCSTRLEVEASEFIRHPCRV